MLLCARIAPHISSGGKTISSNRLYFTFHTCKYSSFQYSVYYPVPYPGRSAFSVLSLRYYDHCFPLIYIRTHSFHRPYITLMKKILHIIDSITFGGGAQEHLIASIEQVKGVEHYCLALHGEENDYTGKFYNVLKHRFSICVPHPLWFLTPFGWFRLIRKIREVSPNVIHTHLFFSYLFICFLYIFGFLRIGFIVTIYNLKSQAPFFEFLGYKFFKRFTSFYAATAKMLIHELTSLGIDSRKIILTDIILDINNYIEQKEDIRKKYGIRDEKVIVRVSRFHPDKGYHQLVTIINEFKKLYKYPFKVLFVGDGIERESTEKLVDKFGLRNEIIFCGWKINYVDYLLAGDLVVCPSINEGFGVANMVALKYGLPFVFFICGSLKTIKDEGYKYAIDDFSVKNFAIAINSLITQPDEIRYASDFAKAFYERNLSFSNIHGLLKCYDAMGD